MESTSQLMALIRAGKRQEALELIERLKATVPLAPNRIKLDRTGAVTFYRGNRRLVKNEAGKWELAHKSKPGSRRPAK